MELEHNFTVAAPVEQAWEVLLDLERIAPCMPGATLTSHEGDEFAGNVQVKLGPVTMTFTGTGRFVERDAEARRMVVQAQGKDKRGGGTARATVTAVLRPDGGSTAVSVHSDLVVTGRVAQFGRGMIVGVSTRLLDQFTDCLSGKLGASEAAAPEAAAPEPAAPEAAAPEPEAPEAAAPEAAAPEPAAPEPAPPAAAPTVGAGSADASPPPPEQPAPRAPAATPAGTRAPAAASTTEVEPIDLLGVTGARAAARRLVPYVLVFLLGALIGGGLVALLAGG